MTTQDAPFESFVDDATAMLPETTVPLAEALQAFGTRAEDPHQHTFVLRDTDLPGVRGFTGALTVVVTGGAGQVSGPAGLCSRLGVELTRLHVTLRDPGDLRGNARRVVAAIEDARAAGALDDDTTVCIEVPAAGSEAGWLEAADEVAAAEHLLALRVDAAGGAIAPRKLVSCIDAALDRETPFTVHGLDRALNRTPGSGRPGFLNVLVATHLLFDGGGDPVGALEETDASALLDRTTPRDLARARRWFTGFASHDVEASLLDLARLPEGWAAR